jgi:hypothetical protein
MIPSMPRLLAAAAVLAGAALVFPIDRAEARKGGSFGLRAHNTSMRIVPTNPRPGAGAINAAGGGQAPKRLGGGGRDLKASSSGVNKDTSCYRPHPILCRGRPRWP